MKSEPDDVDASLHEKLTTILKQISEMRVLQFVWLGTLSKGGVPTGIHACISLCWWQDISMQLIWLSVEDHAHFVMLHIVRVS
jgi:hypothetical protein